MRRIQFTPVDSEENAGEKGTKDWYSLGDGNSEDKPVRKHNKQNFCQQAKRLRK